MSTIILEQYKQSRYIPLCTVFELWAMPAQSPCQFYLKHISAIVYSGPACRVTVRPIAGRDEQVKEHETALYVVNTINRSLFNSAKTSLARH